MQVNALKNSDGIFVNTEGLREEALHFLKYGYYCADPWESPAWTQYWEEQINRCINGYSSGGLKITGDHYGYLNFGQIKLTKEFEDLAEAVASKNTRTRTVGKRKGAAKDVTFPSFWDLDYNYFWTLDIARWGATIEEYEALGLEVIIEPDYLNGGWHMIVGKSRRKGFSYKNGFLLANRYNTVRNSVSVVGAYVKEYMYPEGTMKMASDYINFFNEYTGWAKAREYTDKVNHKKASFAETDDNNITVEKGYKSTILALTFQNNPNAAIGKDGTLVLFEEAGMFPNLKESYTKTRPTLEDGIYTTGQAIIFGTGGDMESGTTDFANLFYHPKINRLLPFNNIWSPKVAPNVKCGFYVPDYWCKPGFIDKHGNSDKVSAYEYELKYRKELEEESNSTDFQNYIQQYSFTPEESFLDVSTNDFPVIELRNQLNKINSEGLFKKKAQPVELYWDTELQAPSMKPDLSSKLSPVNAYPPKDTMDNTGCVVIYESPIPNAPRGLYKAGYDPYRQDQSSGASLGAFYVYKSRNKFSYSGDTIVAEYVGRPKDFDTFNKNVMYLAMIYNLELMHENEVLEVKNYFRQKKRLYLLAAQPDAVISKNIKNSKVARVYGIHMTEKLKDAGEKYIKKWLLDIRDWDENGNKVLNLEKIYSPGLIEELIAYNRKGNFDRVMAFMMVMFQLQEEEEGKEYEENQQHSTAQQLLELQLFKRN
jgi:hypothetical protein